MTLAQIHAALSYYYDNQPALDEEIDRQVADYDQRRAASSDSPVRRRLRAAGKLR
jgi:hypothetical protein